MKTCVSLCWTLSPNPYTMWKKTCFVWIERKAPGFAGRCCAIPPDGSVRGRAQCGVWSLVASYLCFSSRGVSWGFGKVDRRLWGFGGSYFFKNRALLGKITSQQGTLNKLLLLWLRSRKTIMILKASDFCGHVQKFLCFFPGKKCTKEKIAKQLKPCRLLKDDINH